MGETSWEREGPGTPNGSPVMVSKQKKTETCRPCYCQCPSPVSNARVSSVFPFLPWERCPLRPRLRFHLISSSIHHVNGPLVRSS